MWYVQVPFFGPNNGPKWESITIIKNREKQQIITSGDLEMVNVCVFFGKKKKKKTTIEIVIIERSIHLPVLWALNLIDNIQSINKWGLN